MSEKIEKFEIWFSEIALFAKKGGGGKEKLKAITQLNTCILYP